MGEPDRWAELGIAPTVDRSAIRRAYAARSKVVRPDADPQGFARLRTAYEAALADADRPPPAPEPMPQPLHAREPEPAAVPDLRTTAAVTECLRRGDIVAASEVLAAARAEQSLSIAEGVRLADQIGWVLVHDRNAPLPVLLQAAAQLDLAGAAGPWSRTLQARLDAEQWFAALRRRASSRWRWVGAAQAIAARIMLGRGPLRTLGSMSRDPTLRRRYGEYLVHAPYLRERFDAVRIQAVSQLLGGPRNKRPSSLLVLLGVVFIAGAAGAVASDIDPTLRDPVAGVTAVAFFALLTLRRWLGWLRRLRKRSNDP